MKHLRDLGADEHRELIVFVSKESQADRSREAVVLPARGGDELKTFRRVQEVSATVTLRVLLEKPSSISR